MKGGNDTIQIGQWIHFERGAIRIDHIADGQVYYCRWKSGEDVGELLRRPLADFMDAMEYTREVERQEASRP